MSMIDDATLLKYIADNANPTVDLARLRQYFKDVPPTALGLQLAKLWTKKQVFRKNTSTGSTLFWIKATDEQKLAQELEEQERTRRSKAKAASPTVARELKSMSDIVRRSAVAERPIAEADKDIADLNPNATTSVTTEAKPYTGAKRGRKPGTKLDPSKRPSKVSISKPEPEVVPVQEEVVPKIDSLNKFQSSLEALDTAVTHRFPYLETPVYTDPVNSSGLVAEDDGAGDDVAKDVTYSLPPGPIPKLEKLQPPDEVILPPELQPKEIIPESDDWIPESDIVPPEAPTLREHEWSAGLTLNGDLIICCTDGVVVQYTREQSYAIANLFFSRHFNKIRHQFKDV